MASFIYKTFWNEWFWLPEGVTWKDLENTDDNKYHPQVKDLRIAILLAFFVFFIRKILERFVFTKIGEYFGIKDRVPKKATKNTVLESGYRKCKFPKDENLLQLSKQSDLTVRQVERWFRVRRNQDRPSMMARFTEAVWRFSFYFSVFIYGVVILWDKEWFADSMHCWIGYPDQYLSPGIFWYYQIEMSFYFSLTFSQFMDVKRKDFWEMFSHHVATILLMTFSWSANFVRVGTLVLVIHDAVDYWLEFAKIAKYTGFQKVCDVAFAIFGVVWFITRLVIYPTKVIVNTLFHSQIVVGMDRPVWYMFNLLLGALQVMHLYWTYFLVSVVIRKFNQEEVTDIRSSTEEEVSEELEDNTVEFTNHVDPPNCKSDHIAPPTENCNHHDK